jgi:hypothetical protein
MEKTMQDQAKPVAEIVTFRLLAGVDQASFLEAARKTDALFAQPTSYLSRYLSCDAAGTWTDHVEWTSASEAEAGGKLIMSDPAAQPFLAAIDPASIIMRHASLCWKSGN